MMLQAKTCAAAAALFLLPALLRAADGSPADESPLPGLEEPGGPDGWGSELPADGDLDALFEGAGDVDGPVAGGGEEDAGGGASDPPFFLPLRFSGSLAAEAGAAFVRDGDGNDFTGYLDFVNYLNMDARADGTLAVHGSLKTEMPSGSLLELYELYATYLLLDRVYVTVGKKATSWGNVRLFSDAARESEDKDADAHYTNVLYDSREGISGVVTVPVWTGALTGFALYKGNGDSPSSSDLSVAASAEAVVARTSICVFARKFPSEGSSAGGHQSPIVGAEAKRTVLGFDVYAQELVRIRDRRALGAAFSSRGEDLSAFGKFVTTAGICRWWDGGAPTFGFNVEAQDVWSPNAEDGEAGRKDRMELTLGVGRLGPSRNVKVAATWRHDFRDLSGLLKAGASVSGIIPHADLRAGAKWEYGGSAGSRLTLGAYLKLTLGY